jgi:hypothetical protein
MPVPSHCPPTSTKPIPNPRGNQTLPAPKPAPPRSPNGRFTPAFDPKPAETSANPNK